MSRTFVRFFRCSLSSIAACLALAAGASGCSSSSSACSAAFAGAVTEAGSVPAGCGVLDTPADAGPGGGYALKLQASSAHIASLEVSIALGAAPAPGTLSSDTVMEWSASGLSGGASSCSYGAGNQAVPNGSFMLTLTSVTDDAGMRVAHGTLDLTLYVHAPPATDCGPSETEDVALTF